MLTDGRLYGAGVDSLLAREDAAGVVDFALRDMLGSVRRWVDADGSLRGSYRHDSVGNLSSPTFVPVAHDRFLYTAKPVDRHTGFVELRARDYDSEVGRFTSRDLLPDGGLVAGVLLSNPYEYVENRPTEAVDPTGQFAVSGTVILLGAVIGSARLWAGWQAWQKTGDLGHSVTQGVIAAGSTAAALYVGVAFGLLWAAGAVAATNAVAELVEIRWEVKNGKVVKKPVGRVTKRALMGSGVTFLVGRLAGAATYRVL